MSYSLHGSAASSLHVQFGNDQDVAILGGDPSDNPARHLILNDTGNQHALIVEGTTDDFRLLADEICAIADRIDAFDSLDRQDG